MIKAVIFDWGGVLIDNPSEGLLEYFSEKLEIDKKILKENFPEEKFLEFEKGNLSEKELWKGIFYNLKIIELPSELLWKEAVNNVFKDKKEVYEILLELRKKGYKIAILSNTELPTLDYFYEKGYDKYFDEKIFSCIERILKPDKEIYSIALEKLNIRPNEAIFIDDKEENVQSAINIGISGIFFKNPFQLKKEISKLISF